MQILSPRFVDLDQDHECECGGILEFCAMDGRPERWILVRIYRCLACGNRTERDGSEYSTPAILTPEQAVAWKASLMAEHGWEWKRGERVCRRCGVLRRYDGKNGTCVGAPPKPIAVKIQDEDLW